MYYQDSQTAPDQPELSSRRPYGDFRYRYSSLATYPFLATDTTSTLIDMIAVYEMSNLGSKAVYPASLVRIRWNAFSIGPSTLEPLMLSILRCVVSRVYITIVIGPLDRYIASPIIRVHYHVLSPPTRGSPVDPFDGLIHICHSSKRMKIPV
jgi:hypothetical protein